jgi:hypothetical protein
MTYFWVLNYIFKHLDFVFKNKIILIWTHQHIYIGYKNNLPHVQKDSPIISLVIKIGLKSDTRVIYPDYFS